jgi:transcriptional regulator with XRE-family HTH domain
MDSIGKMILFHRQKSGLSRIKLAEISGISKTVIYDIEHGKSSVQFNSINKVLQTLNIKIKFESPLMKTFEEIENEKS